MATITGTTMTVDHIKLKCKAAASWTELDVLGAGELGLESDTLRIKIGDGSTAWTALGYATLRPADIANNLTTATEGKVLDATQGKALKDNIDEIRAVTTIAVG